MIKEAIILAGGLGTRLRKTLPDLPKCMAPVDGRPFLFYVINYLRSQGVERFIFSLGYKHDLIETYIKDQFSTLDYQYSIEEEPLGTGGAVHLACSKALEKNLVIANGDTLFKAKLSEATQFHTSHMAACTLLLKPMRDFDRYGAVELDDKQRVKKFREKQFCKTGTINGGLNLLNLDHFLKKEWPSKFSIETDYLEKSTQEQTIYGWVDDGYFIDIGVPEDYQKAQAELKRPALDLRAIDKNWTLFIDRDGVINHEKKGSYILKPEEFRFYEGVTGSMAKLAGRFGKIIIVSNQRGVGKGLMSEADLRDIDLYMKFAIEKAGGRVDKIYYCSSTDDKHPDRKPNPGMAFRARQDFPSIDLSRSVMLGNKSGDMLFARNAGLYSIFLATTNPDWPYPHPDIDLRFDSLQAFTNSL